MIVPSKTDKPMACLHFGVSLIGFGVAGYLVSLGGIAIGFGVILALMAFGHGVLGHQEWTGREIEVR